jgi:hypothetical protein
MSNVSISSPSFTPEDVFGMLNDHSKHMTNQLKYMLEDDLVKIFKTLSTSSDPYSIPRNPQASSSSALLEPLENPSYGMPKGFTPSQAPPVMSTLPPRPEIAMVMSLLIVEPLNSTLSSATTGQANELANFVHHTEQSRNIPPISPTGTRIPHGPVPD